MKVRALREEATKISRLVNLDQIIREIGTRDITAYIWKVRFAIGPLNLSLMDHIGIWFVLRVLPHPVVGVSKWYLSF